jgi:hypothetical protein
MVQLSPDSDFHFEILRDFSATSCSSGDIVEVLIAANCIVPNNFESYSDAFYILANQVYATANAIDILKNLLATSDVFFRVLTYFRSADFFLHGNAFDHRIYSFRA